MQQTLSWASPRPMTWMFRPSLNSTRVVPLIHFAQKTWISGCSGLYPCAIFCGLSFPLSNQIKRLERHRRPAFSETHIVTHPGRQDIARSRTQVLLSYLILNRRQTLARLSQGWHRNVWQCEGKNTTEKQTATKKKIKERTDQCVGWGACALW